MRGTPSERQGKDWGRRQEEGGKMYRKRRQCFALGGDPGGRQGKEWGNTKGRREN